MTKVAGDWVTRARTQAVLRCLSEAGHRALFVGGCVRNALIGAAVTDIDIATDATPPEVMALAEAAGLHAVPTGAEHGTVTVVSGGLPHEITTFRRDVETDGRRAVVAFSRDVAEDARRRDFTMNALYAEADGTVLDPLGTGLADLAARRVRFIEDARARIREDYLRILRFFRFQAWYGDDEAGLDPETLAAIADGLDGLAGLSRERVGHEMLKLLAAPDPGPSLAAMAQIGVLRAVLPGADPRAVGPLVHLEARAGRDPDSRLRLAALADETVAETLRLSRADLRQLATLRAAATSSEDAATLGYRHGAATAAAALLLRAAFLEEDRLPDPAEIDRGAAAVFPLAAADLMPERSGPALGAALKAAEAHWIATGFTASKAALLDWLAASD